MTAPRDQNFLAGGRVPDVAPMIADHATYWFTDGSYQELPQISEAIMETFAAIQNETYEVA